MNKCLLENQQVWQKKVTVLESQVHDLSQNKEQVGVFHFCLVLNQIKILYFLLAGVEYRGKKKRYDFD